VSFVQLISMMEVSVERLKQYSNALREPMLAVGNSKYGASSDTAPATARDRRASRPDRRPSRERHMAGASRNGEGAFRSGRFVRPQAGHQALFRRDGIGIDCSSPSVQWQSRALPVRRIRHARISEPSKSRTQRDRPIASPTGTGRRRLPASARAGIVRLPKRSGVRLSLRDRPRQMDFRGRSSRSALRTTGRGKRDYRSYALANHRR
jgi:hypothetical protein